MCNWKLLVSLLAIGSLVSSCSDQNRNYRDFASADLEELAPELDASAESTEKELPHDQDVINSGENKSPDILSDNEETTPDSGDDGEMNDEKLPNSSGNDPDPMKEPTKPSPEISSSCVYVSLGSANSLGIFKRNPDNGDLTSVESFATSGSPKQIAISSDQSKLYLGLGNKIEVVTTDAASCKLSHHSVKDIKIGAQDFRTTYLSLSKDDSHIFTVSFGDGFAQILKIKEDGSIGQRTHDFSTGLKPHSIVPSLDKSFFYIPERDSDQVEQFRFNYQSGQLEPLNPPAEASRNRDGPRHMVFHHEQPWAYVSNEFSNSVGFYQQNSDGTLTLKATVDSLESPMTEITSADVHLTPNGKFLYVSNRDVSANATPANHRCTIGMYKLNADGVPKFLGQVPTVWFPREFTISGDGKHLLAAGQFNDYVQVYKIGDDGRLESLKLYDLNNIFNKNKTGPGWIEVIDFL